MRSTVAYYISLFDHWYDVHGAEIRFLWDRLHGAHAFLAVLLFYEKLTMRGTKADTRRMREDRREDVLRAAQFCKSKSIVFVIIEPFMHTLTDKAL